MQDKSKPRLDAHAPGHNSTTLKPVPLSTLRLRPGDPRRFSASDIERAERVWKALPASASAPVIVNESNEVLIGGLFVEAARKAGVEVLLVIVHAGLSELEEKHYSIAINQLLSRGEWDPDALEAWVRELESGLTDFSHLDIGFADGELDRVLSLSNDPASMGCEADAVPPVRRLAIAQRGRLWRLGRHLVTVGDATNADDMKRLMAGEVAKMVMTDPPFGCPIDGFVSRKGLHRDFVQAAGELSPEELKGLFVGFMANLARHLRPGALVYIFIDWRSLNLLLEAGVEVFGSLIQFCCWVKDRAGMGGLYRSQHELVLVFRAPGGNHTNNVQLGRHGRNRSNVWSYPSAASSRSGREGDMLKLHPTPKTVEMVADAILDCTGRHERVIDCFLGSGTTLIAAERTGRICHAMDLDPLYVDVAIRRWQTWTGLGAIEADSGQTFDDLAQEAQEGAINHG